MYSMTKQSREHIAYLHSLKGRRPFAKLFWVRFGMKRHFEQFVDGSLFPTFVKGSDFGYTSNFNFNS